MYCFLFAFCMFFSSLSLNSMSSLPKPPDFYSTLNPDKPPYPYQSEIHTEFKNGHWVRYSIVMENPTVSTDGCDDKDLLHFFRLRYRFDCFEKELVYTRWCSARKEELVRAQQVHSVNAWVSEDSSDIYISDESSN